MNLIFGWFDHAGSKSINNGTGHNSIDGGTLVDDKYQLFQVVKETK